MGRNEDIYQHVIACLRSGACEFGKGDEIFMQCPGCGAEDGHFSINGRSGLYNCFKNCGTAGNLKPLIIQNREEWFKLVRHTSDRLSRHSGGYFAICPLAGENIPLFSGDTSQDKASLRHTQVAKATRYCLRRGMTRKQIKEYQVFVKPFDSRVYFPYWNDAGEMVFWTARAANDTIKPKTLHSDNTNLPLFGRHVRAIRNEVVLLEGIFDHFVTPGSYAILGSNVTTSQIIQLREDNVKRIFLILDPDASEQAGRTARKMGNFRFDVFPVILGGKRDPAECGREKMARIVQTIKRHHPVRPQAIYFE